MTALDPETAVDPLDPVRGSLLARAHADADAIRAEAESDAAALGAEAERESAAILAEARAQGEADAAVVLGAERARARRQARAVVLGAQREAYEALRRHVRTAVAALRDDPGYPDLRSRLAAMARADLAGPGDVAGEDVSVRDAPGGGVVAEAPGRRAVYTLEALADRAVDGRGADLASLWAGERDDE
ncbi:MAG: V-type ATP synthase subunit E family protein [Actinomycetes bacterium]